jgi:hypothetical protein
MLDFSQHLTDAGITFYVFLLLATLFQIGILLWCLAVDSVNVNNRRVLKWQCLLTTFASALVLCFGAGVNKLTNDANFYLNSTRVGPN